MKLSGVDQNSVITNGISGGEIEVSPSISEWVRRQEFSALQYGDNRGVSCIMSWAGFS